MAHHNRLHGMTHCDVENEPRGGDPKNSLNFTTNISP